MQGNRSEIDETVFMYGDAENVKAMHVTVSVCSGRRFYLKINEAERSIYAARGGKNSAKKRIYSKKRSITRSNI